jgi:hypothetical protein
MTPEQRMATLEAKLEQQIKEIDGLRSDVRELVDAWKAAGAFVAFVKTAAAVVLAVGVIVGAFKFGINPDATK